MKRTLFSGLLILSLQLCACLICLPSHATASSGAEAPSGDEICVRAGGKVIYSIGCDDATVRLCAFSGSQECLYTDIGVGGGCARVRIPDGECPDRSTVPVPHPQSLTGGQKPPKPDLTKTIGISPRRGGVVDPKPYGPSSASSRHAGMDRILLVGMGLVLIFLLFSLRFLLGSGGNDGQRRHRKGIILLLLAIGGILLLMLIVTAIGNRSPWILM